MLIQGRYLVSLPYGLKVFPLRPGTKEPFEGIGVYQATDDPEQIIDWWQWQPQANIALTGPLFLDFDTRTPESLLGPNDLKTWIVSTPGRNGKHVYYLQPAGELLGNIHRPLPPGVHVRGYGGYVVAPGSILPEGSYEFVRGHTPNHYPIATLPAHIHTMLLQGKKTSSERPVVVFSATTPRRPDLRQFELSRPVTELICTGVPRGIRSDADWRVIRSLVEASASDDAIRAVFANYPIGSKYREKKHNGDRYLALTISKARAAQPGTSAGTGPRITEITPGVPIGQARRVLGSPILCAGVLRSHGITRPEQMTPLCSHLAVLAQQAHSTRVRVTKRELQKACNCSSSTAMEQLRRLAAAGLILLETSPETGTRIDLTALIQAAAEAQNPRDVVNGRFLPDSNDDAFAQTTYVAAIQRREMPTALLPSLGRSGPLVWEALQRGPCTVRDLAARTGLCEKTVRNVLARFKACSLLLIYQRGRTLFYELHPNAEGVLEGKKPEMTTFGIGNLRAGQAHTEIAMYAGSQLNRREDLSPVQKQWLERRKEHSWKKARECYKQACNDFGINCRLRKGFSNYDLIEIFSNFFQNARARLQQMPS
jgi:hypothetical protein